MAKIIAKKETEAPLVPANDKIVEIKHTRVMKDAAGKDVEVVDYVETKQVDEAISQAEERKASLEAQVAELDAELVEYNAIKDAE